MDAADAPTAEIDAAEKAADEINTIRNWLVQCNVRLVVRIARQHTGPHESFADAVSEGNLAMMRAVERFDYTRGFRFSTYASWAIMKRLASTLPAEALQRRHFTPVDNDVLTANADLKTLGPEQTADREGLRLAMADLLEQLPEREKAVLIEHFGLGGATGSTLEQIGQRWGLSKERVRQIKASALTRLKGLMPSGMR